MFALWLVHAQLSFCLAKNVVKQFFLLNIFMKLGPCLSCHNTQSYMVLNTVVSLLIRTSPTRSMHAYRGCVRLASLVGRPRSATVPSNSFDGAHPGQPPCGVGHLGVTWGTCRHHERASVIVRLALVLSGAHPSEHCGVDPGKLNERPDLTLIVGTPSWGERRSL